MRIPNVINMAWFLALLYLGYNTAVWMINDNLGFCVLCLLALGVVFGAATGTLPDNWYVADKPQRSRQPDAQRSQRRQHSR